MRLDSITPLILTYNEAPNIGRTLERLRWARRIVVVDSFSSDETVTTADRFENVRVCRRRFDDHTAQWNFGLAQVETGWVLALDADYCCPRELVDEIARLDDDCDAYLAAFTYCIHGRPLRGSLYPPRAVLFRPDRCHYVQDGHTQLLVHDRRRTRRMVTKILHDDRKPLVRWLEAQTKYAELEARKLLNSHCAELGWKDRLRRWYVVAPLLVLFHCLFVKRLILDGRAGLFYTLQRVYSEVLLGLALLNHRLRPDDQPGVAPADSDDVPATHREMVETA